MVQVKAHGWPRTVAGARKVQQRYRSMVVLEDEIGKIEYLAGVDIGFEGQGETTLAAVVVLDARSLHVVDQSIIRRKTRFPYVPGYLSFREVPAALAAIKRLKVKPDVFICDGQGLAHPRRFGMACHLGVLLDMPSIGVAKSRLVGTYGNLPNTKGRWTPLLDKKEVIGAVLRTRRNVKPVFVSPGHKLCLETAIKITMQAVTRYRLPETTRLAHHLVSAD